MIKIHAKQMDLDAFSHSRRAVILLNHPDRQDPFVIVQLAKQMHEAFYCIAARECFDWDRGWRGWLFQRLGCYSVARGKADFHSIATTKKILRQGKHKLVVFPEAEITADDDNLHELNKTIFHIILDVQKELLDGKSNESEKSVAVIPAAIKFSLKVPLEAAVAGALSNIEARLDLKDTAGMFVKDRIDVVVGAYLGKVFSSYGIEMPQESLAKLPEIAAIAIVGKIASSISLDIPCDLSVSERLYMLRNNVAEKSKNASIALFPHAFRCAGVVKPSLASDFERIERLLILERMLAHSSSEIQCCRILDFIESELFGTISPKGWQSCDVSLGAPVDVTPFVELYSQSRERGVNCLNEIVSQQMQSMLVSLHRPQASPL